LEQCCKSWSVSPLDIEEIESSYFGDEARFTPESVGFDCAFQVRDVAHEWQDRGDLCCATHEVVHS
jgi:hypothetical protein